MIECVELEPLAPFRDTPRAVIAALAAVATELRVGADAVLFTEGSLPRGWYVVLQGNIRVVRLRGARQHVIHTEGVGGTLGEVPLFAGGTHPATGISTEPSRLALFSRPALDAAISSNPAVAFLLLQRLAARVRALVDRLDDRSARSVSARLALFLIERHNNAVGANFSFGMTQQQLAEELGTAREVVSRELLALRRAGLIEPVGNGRYRVLHLDGLQRITLG